VSLTKWEVMPAILYLLIIMILQVAGT
jgi:hypothetical protein